MLAKLTLVVVLFGAYGIRAEHAGSSAQDRFRHPQFGRFSENAVASPASEAFSELKKLILGQLDSHRILNTPASTLWFKTGQHSFLDSFIRYNFKYRDYLLGQKCVVMVPTL
jgi:hypothetical protein